MGYGSYKSTDWAKLKSSRGIKSSSNVSEIFNNKMNDRYNPKFIDMRESCDSEDSPLSTPIIIAFDDTASMGYLAEEIAKNTLNRTITEIYDKQPVTNPHIMCAAFGNYLDSAPLQVTQYEADIKIAEQLFDLWIESRGQGYSGDVYIWYFAAKHTKIDSIIKRNKKGFLFTIGDDFCNKEKGIDVQLAKKVFNDDIPSDLTREQIINMVNEKYELFHIVTKSCRLNGFENWCNLLPGRVSEVKEDGIKYLSEIIISIMQISSGSNKEKVIDQWDEHAKPIVKKAVSTINLNPNIKMPIQQKTSTDTIQPQITKNPTAQTEKTKKSLLERLLGK